MTLLHLYLGTTDYGGKWSICLGLLGCMAEFDYYIGRKGWRIGANCAWFGWRSWSYEWLPRKHDH